MSLKKSLRQFMKLCFEVNNDTNTTHILVYCIDHFEDNVYVVELNEKGTTNKLSISLYYIKKELFLPWKVLIFCRKKKMKI
jgi:hypothetical protein